MFDPMADLEGEKPSVSFSDKPGASRGKPRKDGKFAEDLHTVSFRTEQRTFYFDLKESEHGKFVKLSEKSRNGRKSTIMLDSEDIDEFINAFNEIKEHL